VQDYEHIYIISSSYVDVMRWQSGLLRLP